MQHFPTSLENMVMQISLNIKYTKYVTDHYKYFLSRNSYGFCVSDG